jgi:serine/threonine protein kinase
MMVVYTASGKRIELQNTLGAGGEGTVYRVNAKVCAKLYAKPSAFKEAKIKTMIAKPPVPLTNPGNKNGRVAWPTEVLYDRRGGSFVGYLMPLIEVRNYQESEMVFIEKQRTKKFGQRFTYEHLMTAAYNFAMTVHYIHQAGHSVGDLREKNILVDNTGQICLVDCDSFQVIDEKNKRFFASETYTPGYLAPEYIGKSLAKENRRDNDYFALAVWVFQMLMNGMHPYQARGGKADQCPSLEEKIKKGTYPYGRIRGIRPPVAAPEFSQVPGSLQVLFQAAFEIGQKDPSKRPMPLAFANTLKREIARLKSCRKNRNHKYSGDLARCPFCQRKVQPARPNPIRSNPIRPKPGRINPVRPNPARPNPVRPNPVRGRPSVRLPKLAKVALFLMLLMGLLSRFEKAYESNAYEHAASEAAPAAEEQMDYSNSLQMDDFYLWYTGGVLYTERWDEPKFKEDFRINGQVMESAIATYIPSDQTNNGDHSMTVELSAQSTGTAHIRFGAETWWCYGPEFGNYCLAFFVNEEMVANTLWMEYNETGSFELELKEGDLLAILIREQAGPKGTLNPIIAFE